MCICVDCKWVDRCKAYHTVEKQHGVKHLNLNPDFDPKEPIIHISLKDEDEQVGNTLIEWDVQGCKSFSLDNGKWLRLRPNEQLPK